MGANLALPWLCARFCELTPRGGFLEPLSRAFEAPGPSAVLCTEIREPMARDRAARLQKPVNFPEKRLHVRVCFARSLFCLRRPEVRAVGTVGTVAYDDAIRRGNLHPQDFDFDFIYGAIARIFPGCIPYARIPYC